MIYIFLANGFEEVEALATVDVLRRADLKVKFVGVGSDVITGAHGISTVRRCGQRLDTRRRYRSRYSARRNARYAESRTIR